MPLGLMLSLTSDLADVLQRGGDRFDEILVLDGGRHGVGTVMEGLAPIIQNAAEVLPPRFGGTCCAWGHAAATLCTCTRAAQKRPTRPATSSRTLIVRPRGCQCCYGGCFKFRRCSNGTELSVAGMTLPFLVVDGEGGCAPINLPQAWAHGPRP